MTTNVVPWEIRIFQNHIYEYKKGVRNMILYTLHCRYKEFAIKRLESQDIPYYIQRVNESKINLYFGKPECLEAVRQFIVRPLNQLTPEEDFILGTLLGYDICKQCKRYIQKKGA